jgi:hypothetical protein
MKRETLAGKTFGKWKVFGWDSAKGKWITHCECGQWGVHTRTTLEREESTQCMKCYTRRIPVNESAFNAVWNDYVQQSRRRKRTWSLTKDEARGLFSQSCFYCGNEPSAIKTIPNGRGSFTFNGIDRVDNALDYVYSNCVPCCRVCNFMKREMSTADFLDHIDKIIKRRSIK